MRKEGRKKERKKKRYQSIIMHKVETIKLFRCIHDNKSNIKNNTQYFFNLYHAEEHHSVDSVAEYVCSL
jgi:hypothetical protein